MNTRTSSRKPAALVSTARVKVKAAAALAIPAKSKAPEAAPGRVTRPRAVQPVPPAAVDFSDSKQAGVIAMLRRPAGATIPQMMTFTGWQAHTVRGTISGVLRKKLGLNVTCEPAAGSSTSLYRIVGSAGV